MTATSKQAHTVLVAFCVHADDFADAQRRLMRNLPRPGSDGLDSWWIAEDERIDGSDNDSAIFVPMGTCRQSADMLASARVLATAPKLLAACEAIMRFEDDPPHRPAIVNVDTKERLFSDMRTAVYEARGEVAP